MERTAVVHRRSKNLETTVLNATELFEERAVLQFLARSLTTKNVSFDVNILLNLGVHELGRPVKSCAVQKHTIETQPIPYVNLRIRSGRNVRS